MTSYFDLLFRSIIIIAMFFKSLDKSGVILKVLLVDADKTSQLILTAMIKRFGYDVSVAVDCQQALDILQQYPVCLVLIAANNHDVSSLQICSQLKNHNNSFSLYIILLSADHSVEYMIKALENGVHDVLPISPVPVQLKCRMGVGQRALMAKEELIIARDEAETSNQSKSAFLANMSHELRTPLNAIIGYSEMMKEDAIFDERGQDKDDHDKVLNASNHLLSLINDLLDLSKIEAGKMLFSFERHLLSALLEIVEETTTPLLGKNNNKLVVQLNCIDQEVVVDSMRFLQIMYNLISNASKFSNNSTIKVDVSTVLINNQGIFSVKVIDQGIGMTKDQLSMLFNNYVQAHAKIVDQYGGTGLGLALSKKLANMTGGNLVATSEIDVGSVFELTLPLQQEKNVVAF